MSSKFHFYRIEGRNSLAGPIDATRQKGFVPSESTRIAPKTGRFQRVVLETI